MGVYAAIGVCQALAFAVMGSMFALLTYFASRELHRVSNNDNQTFGHFDSPEVSVFHPTGDARANVVLRDNGKSSFASLMFVHA